jgi:hypothetical protein
MRLRQYERQATSSSNAPSLSVELGLEPLPRVAILRRVDGLDTRFDMITELYFRAYQNIVHAEAQLVGARCIEVPYSTDLDWCPRVAPGG